jgi:membrane protein insertase Oxa1/YidC/SpoIIIJ
MATRQRIQYAGTAIQYFASLIVVEDQQDFLAWSRPTVERVRDPNRIQLDDIMMRVVSQPLDLKPQEEISHKYLLYNGPVKVRLLADGQTPISPELLHRYIDVLQLNTLTDFHLPNPVSGFFNLIGWSSLLIFMTNVMHSILYWLHALVPNYGLCVILLTVLVRGTGPDKYENAGPCPRDEETGGRT